MRLWFVTGEDDGKFVALCVCFSRHTQTMDREISALKGFLLVFYNKTTQRTTERENLCYQTQQGLSGGGGTIGAQFPGQTPHMKQVWPIWNMTHHDPGDLRRQAKYFQGNVFGGCLAFAVLNCFVRQLQFCSYHQPISSAQTNRSKISY